MDKTNSLAEVAIEAFRSRITRILPAQIRACVEQLDEEQLWWRPNEQTNSVGNLVLHLSGSMRHYLSRGVGGVEYERDRPSEFAERGPLPKQEVLSTFDQAIDEVTRVLNGFDAARFLEPTSEPNYYPTLFDQIFGVAAHVATHAGQIIFVTKMLKEGSLDELWIRTHRADRKSE